MNSPENVLLSLQTGLLALSLMSASAPLSDLALHLMEGRRCRPAVILLLGLLFALVWLAASGDLTTGGMFDGD